MIKLLKRNPVLRFLLLGTIAYLAWYIAYEFWLKPNSNIDAWVIQRIINGTRFVLTLFGYELLESIQNVGFENRVGIQGSSGVIVGAPCDGLVLFALFAAFILAYPGRWKHKAWYLPVGILGIHAINVARVAALAIIVNINPNWLAFNHDYTFTILVYSFVFLLWYIWVQRFSHDHPADRQKEKKVSV
jgi:exosortase family protein XrtF